MDIDRVFSEASRHLGVRKAIAEFYPYSELKHTWSTKDGLVRFKISDYLDSAPENVIRSLALYLLAKANERPIDEGAASAYIAYSRSRQLWQGKKDIYFRRARAMTPGARGDHRDLGAVFEYVNSFYFSGRLPRLTLAWSRESPRQRLGFFFEPLDLLAVNKVLDSEQVPRYVLEFVVYHELLHYVNPSNGARTRRVHHTIDFKRQERAFTHFEDAEKWLRKLVRNHRRKKR